MIAGGTARAIIANPEPCTVTQPDGSEVTLRLYGDEHYNYTLTTEGYGVMYNAAARTWEYSRLAANGIVVPSGELAVSGKAPLHGVRGLRPLPPVSSRSAASRRLETGKYDYDNFRGLVILVEYSDAPFSRSDIREVMDDMINKPGYDGYVTTGANPHKEEYTGSVRDYYFDNSGGRFDPKFDVVGPVEINMSQYSAGQTSNAQRLVTTALKAADSQIDYSRYDTDGDGTVDMIYFIFSGAGSNFSGNDERLIWPHASYVGNLTLDGVAMGRYACSTELYGKPSQKLLDGIGTMCHEFSHVLGLADLYDTDYKENGQAQHPDKWSVMASGPYLNKSRTPCGYSLYERYALGFAVPRLIGEEGSYSITPLNEGTLADGCRINTPVDNEFFLLENRRRTGWDAYLPGEGMLVSRVDSTNVAVWDNNEVNASAAHTYFTLLRATPSIKGTTVTDSDGDPFPGSGSVTALDNTTNPSLRSWTMVSNPLVIESIAISQDGNVTFDVKKDEVPTLLEDFALMEPAEGDAEDVAGRFARWTFLKGAAIVKPGTDGASKLATIKGSEIICNTIEADVENVAITITNPTTSNAIFRLYTSIDGGEWITAKTVSGSSSPSVGKGQTLAIHYNTGSLVNPSLKLMQVSGSITDKCFVDCVEVMLKAGSDPSGVDGILFDGMQAQEEWYDIHGRHIAVPEAAHGVFIRRCGNEVVKVIR
ncbi:M6 family metalloprotease domain-containing protein [uncultured Muribaculum sp.]|nr:M6 family metalloprotease domain-containing protein [uncultured Muribaculum sp.]